MAHVSYLCVIYFVLFQSTVCEFAPALPQPGYRLWVPRNINRTDLFCPIECDGMEAPEQCCLCKARVCWEINSSLCNVTLRALHVEYMDLNGTSILLHNGATGKQTIYVLKHTDGHLTTFPTNLNDYINIIEIDLSRNSIKEIPNISFLHALSVLILDSNLVTYISNDTFKGLVSLRQISLAQNLIRHIEPNSFFSNVLSIFQVNISFNQLKNIDATIVFPQYPLCEIDLSNNNLMDILNPTGFILNETQTYGPGRVFMENNHLNLPNFTMMGISDWTTLAKHAKYKWGIRNQTELTCDCILFQYFDKVKLGNLRRVLIDFDFLECSSPAQFSGKKLSYLYQHANYDEFICNLTIDCPRNCHCYDQPSHANVVVDCEGKGLTELPQGPLPVGLWGNQKLELRMRNNNITKIGDKDYIGRIVSMDLLGNPINVIEDSAAEAMRDDIKLNIPDSKLQSLPSSFIYLDPNNINTGNNGFLCSCKIVWMDNWQYKLFSNRTRYVCSINGIVMLVSEIRQNLHCDSQQETLTVKIISASLAAIVTFLLLIVIFFYLRYEIRILFTRVTSRVQETKIQNPKVFISHDETDEEVSEWVNKDLNPCLCHEGVRTIVTWLDLPIGESREVTTKLAICECNAYIVVLSENYNQQDLNVLNGESSRENGSSWTKIEFSSIWNQCFNLRQTKLLIVVNFQHLSPGHYKDRRLRALCRVGYILDYSKREEKMLIRIKKCLNISERSELSLQENTSSGKDKEINVTTSESRKIVSINKDRNKSFYSNSDVRIRMEQRNIQKFEVTETYPKSTAVRVGKGVFGPNSRQTTCNRGFRKCYIHDDVFHP